MVNDRVSLLFVIITTITIVIVIAITTVSVLQPGPGDVSPAAKELRNQRGPW